MSRGARFLWVLNPASISEGYGPVQPLLNGIYQRVGELRAEFVDAWTGFGGPYYNAALHVPGGLHLSKAGQDRMAALIVGEVTNG